MAYNERELLARLIQCEAGGEGENGMKAVAGVVMNRVNVIGGEYDRLGQGDLYNIIFQPGSSPAWRKILPVRIIPRTSTICDPQRKTTTLRIGP